MLPLDFTWTAPDSCPTQAEVVSQLSQAVDADEKDWPALSAHATVEHNGAQWHLQLDTEMDGRKGSRLLQADSCEGLARAATLVMALTFGEGLARRQAEAEARAAEPPKPPPAPPPQPQPAKVAPKPPAAARQREALAWLTPTFGMDPLGAATPGLALGVAWQPTLFRVAAKVGGTLQQSTALVGVEGSLTGKILYVTFAACLVPTFRSVQLLACAEGGFTDLFVQGRGTARDRAHAVPLYGVGPSLAAEWLFASHGFLSLGVSSQFFLRRPELVVEDLTETRKVEMASLTASLGGGVRW